MNCPFAFSEPSLIFVPGNLDQIPIRVPEVNRADGARGAGALHGSEFDRNTVFRKPLPHGIERPLRDQAEIRGSRRGAERVRRDFCPCLMEIDLRISKLKREPLFSKPHGFHAKNRFIKTHCRLGVPDCQHQVIKPHDKRFVVFSYRFFSSTQKLRPDRR